MGVDAEKAGAFLVDDLARIRQARPALRLAAEVGIGAARARRAGSGGAAEAIFANGIANADDHDGHIPLLRHIRK